MCTSRTEHNRPSRHTSNIGYRLTARIQSLKASGSWRVVSSTFKYKQKVQAAPLKSLPAASIRFCLAPVSDELVDDFFSGIMGECRVVLPPGYCERLRPQKVVTGRGVPAPGRAEGGFFAGVLSRREGGLLDGVGSRGRRCLRGGTGLYLERRRRRGACRRWRRKRP